MSRVVAVLTASRGDYWPLEPLLQGLEQDPRFVLHVLVGGGHDGVAVNLPGERQHRLAGTAPASDSALDLDAVVAAFSTETGRVLSAVQPDLLVVLGDRYELLGVAAAALLHRVPLVHLNGGELTEGAHDDAVRHAVTKLAHLHLTAHESYARRVVGLGEEPWRVHVVGEPGLDRLIAHAGRFTEDDLAHRLGVQLQHPIALLTYHPPTMTPELLDVELDAVLKAVEGCPTVIATHPGHEPGRSAVLKRLTDWAASRAGAVLVPSLGEMYPTALALADVMIGNSSSGLVEAPVFGLPVVNVGDRQQGRVRAGVVIDAPAVGVGAALETALSTGFREAVAGSGSPYGDGRSTPRVLDVLAEVELDRLLRKRFYEDPA